MNKFKDFSSFFFPSKGTFGGVQRRSANGYPEVRRQDRRKIVYSDNELQQAFRQQSDGDVIILAADVALSAPLLFRKKGVTFDLGGRTIYPTGVMDSAFILSVTPDTAPRTSTPDANIGTTIKNGNVFALSSSSYFDKIVSVPESTKYVTRLKLDGIAYFGTVCLYHQLRTSTGTLEFSKISNCCVVTDSQTIRRNYSSQTDAVLSYSLSMVTISGNDFGHDGFFTSDIDADFSANEVRVVDNEFTSLTFVNNPNSVCITGNIIKGSITGVTDGVDGCAIGHNAS